MTDTIDEPDEDEDAPDAADVTAVLHEPRPTPLPPDIAEVSFVAGGVLYVRRYNPDAPSRQMRALLAGINEPGVCRPTSRTMR